MSLACFKRGIETAVEYPGSWKREKGDFNYFELSLKFYQGRGGGVSKPEPNSKELRIKQSWRSTVIKDSYKLADFYTNEVGVICRAFYDNCAILRAETAIPWIYSVVSLPGQLAIQVSVTKFPRITHFSMSRTFYRPYVYHFSVTVYK